MPYQNIMNSHSLVILLLLLCALFCVQSVEGSKNLEEENDDAVELNPDYVEPSETTKDSDKDDDEESDGDDGDEVETFDASKGAIAQALLKSRKQSRKAKKFVKKNRSKITTVLTVFAFRREIRQVLLRLATKQLVDPKTGKLRLNLTATLKLLLSRFIAHDDVEPSTAVALPVTFNPPPPNVESAWTMRLPTMTLFAT